MPWKYDISCNRGFNQDAYRRRSYSPLPIAKMACSNQFLFSGSRINGPHAYLIKNFHQFTTKFHPPILQVICISRIREELLETSSIVYSYVLILKQSDKVPDEKQPMSAISFACKLFCDFVCV